MVRFFAVVDFVMTFLTGIRWYYFAMLGCLVLGGCGGCTCERHRPHIFIGEKAEEPHVMTIQNGAHKQDVKFDVKAK